MKGHVERRGGRYRALIELDPTFDEETGDRIRRRRSVGSFRTKREADEALRDALDLARRGWQGPSRLTVAEFLRDEWIPAIEMDRAETTVALYTTLMETYVIPRIGGLRLEAITPSDLTKMYKGLLTAGSRTGKGLAPKTVRHVHTTLRRALADAVDAKYLTWNPAAHAKAPKVPRNKKPSAWTAQQVRSFLGHVEGDRLEALWILAATSGMRRGELLGLRWRDVDLDAGELHIRRTQVSYGKLRVEKEPKTARSERPLPLPPSTVEALRAHHRRQSTEKLRAGAAYTDDGFVFCDEIGLPLIPANVSTAFGRHVKAAGLPRLTLHGLRHSYATVALEAGVDVLYVSELLGHASVSITMDVYQHSRPERLEAAANAIADAIGG